MLDSSRADYDWHSWYSGIPLIQREWKRSIGTITKEFLGEPSSLLDVGCGSSPTINLFSCRRLGLDVNKEKLKFMRLHSTAKFMYMDVSKGINLDGYKFDAAICNAIIEHVHNPEKLLTDVRDLLEPGGKLVVAAPCLDGLFSYIFQSLYDKLGAYKEEHVSRITSKWLNSTCKSLGFKLLREKRVVSDIVRLYQKEL